MDVKASDQCSVPPSLHVDLKVSPPRPFLLSSLANTLLGVAHHTYRVPSAKGYAVHKGYQSGSYRVPSARSRALRYAPGALRGRRRAYGALPAESLPAGHCGAPLAPLLRRGASSRRRGYPRLAPCVACRPAPRACAQAPYVAWAACSLPPSCSPLAARALRRCWRRFSLRRWSWGLCPRPEAPPKWLGKVPRQGWEPARTLRPAVSLRPAHPACGLLSRSQGVPFGFLRLA